jgi:hypothetical protein
MEALALAFVAVFGETLFDVLEPWPIRSLSTTSCNQSYPDVFRFCVGSFWSEQTGSLEFRCSCGRGITVLGAISSYVENI